MNQFRVLVSARLNLAIVSTAGLLCWTSLSAAQQLPDDVPVETIQHVEPASPAPAASLDRHVKLKNSALILGQSLAVAWYGHRKWWQDGFQRKFRSENEGWFGQDTYAGGTDKVGHFYTNYVFSRLMASSFRAFGNEPHHAVLLGAALTLGTMTAVEILDGYSKTWHFSREDATMNLLGAGSAFLLETYPRLDQLVDLRFKYQQSTVDEKGFDPAGDYSGQTYLLVLKASGIPALREHPWLRYVELAAGYTARNYDRPELIDQRRRDVVFGISLNLSEVFRRTVFRNTSPDRRVRRVVDSALEYIQVPGTAVYGYHQLSKN